MSTKAGGLQKWGVTFRAMWLNKSDEFTGISIEGGRRHCLYRQRFLKVKRCMKLMLACLQEACAGACTHTHTADAQRRHIKRDTTRRVFFPLGFLWPQLPLSWRRSAHRLFFVFNPTHLMSAFPRRLAGSHAVARDGKSGFSAVYVRVNLLRFIVHC